MKIFNTSGKLIILIIILGLVGLMGYAIFGTHSNVKTSPLIGKQAPDFTLKTFDGKDLALSDLKGKTILLNFWASWCMPCRQEAGALESAWQKYKDKDVIFIGVNVWDESSNAQSYLDQFGSGYTNALDPQEEIQVNYGIGGVPETFFIDSLGNVRDKFTGPLTEQIIDYYVLKAKQPEKNES